MFTLTTSVFYDHGVCMIHYAYMYIHYNRAATPCQSHVLSQIRTGPGFAFVTNEVSVSNTSSIEIILLSRTS